MFKQINCWTNLKNFGSSNWICAKSQFFPVPKYNETNKPFTFKKFTLKISIDNFMLDFITTNKFSKILLITENDDNDGKV